MKRLLLAPLIFTLLSTIGALADNHIEQLREKSRSLPNEFITYTSGALWAICEAHANRFISNRDSKTIIKWHLDEMQATLKPLPEYNDISSGLIKIFSEKYPSCAKVLNSYK